MISSYLCFRFSLLFLCSNYLTVIPPERASHLEYLLRRVVLTLFVCAKHQSTFFTQVKYVVKYTWPRELNIWFSVLYSFKI